MHGTLHEIVTPARSFSCTGPLLEKLQRNHGRNLAAVRRAGYEEQWHQARCEKCGLLEPVLWWTPAGRRSHTLILRCPSGCETRVRYDFRSNTIHAGGDWRKSHEVSVLVSLAAFVFLVLSLYFGTRFESIPAAWEAMSKRLTEISAELPDVEAGESVRTESILAQRAKPVREVIEDVADTTERSLGAALLRARGRRDRYAPGIAAEFGAPAGHTSSGVRPNDVIAIVTK